MPTEINHTSVLMGLCVKKYKLHLESHNCIFIFSISLDTIYKLAINENKDIIACEYCDLSESKAVYYFWNTIFPIWKIRE